MTELTQNTAASTVVNPDPRSAVSDTASSTASRPNRVVNLIIGFNATEEVSLNGSPTVSPTTVAAWSSVPFSFNSTSTTFLALSQAPPAFAIKTAWKSPNTAIEIKKLIKNETGLTELAGAEKRANER